MTDKETQLALNRIKKLTDEDYNKITACELDRLNDFRSNISYAECWLEGALEVNNLSILSPYQVYAEKYFPEAYKKVMHERRMAREKEKRKEKIIFVINILLFTLFILSIIIVPTCMLIQ